MYNLKISKTDYLYCTKDQNEMTNTIERLLDRLLHREGIVEEEANFRCVNVSVGEAIFQAFTLLDFMHLLPNNR